MITTFQKWLSLHEDVQGQQPMGMGQQPMGQQPMGQQPMGQQPTGQQPEQGALSDPQHQADEESMNVSTIIQRRLEMLLDELEKKRNMTRDQMMGVLGQVMGALQEKGMKKSQMTQSAGQAFQQPQMPAQPDQQSQMQMPAQPA
jgi:hypothetical protein